MEIIFEFARTRGAWRPRVGVQVASDNERNYKRSDSRLVKSRRLMAFGWGRRGSLNRAGSGINLIPKTASSRYAGKLHPAGKILLGEGGAFILIYANNMAYISRILSYFYGDARLSGRQGRGATAGGEY